MHALALVGVAGVAIAAGCGERNVAGSASTEVAPASAPSPALETECVQAVVTGADGTVGAGVGGVLARAATSPVLDGAQLTTLDGGYTLEIHADPPEVRFGRLFALDVRLANADGSRTAAVLSVDGAMPHHEHGLNTTPRAAPAPDGSFRVEGMLLHMPGAWELYFDVTDRGLTERAKLELVVR